MSPTCAPATGGPRPRRWGDLVELLGLGVPDDEQAAAGSDELSADALGSERSDDDLTTGDPHLDLYVYDTRAPEGTDEPPHTGTPNVAASSTGPTDRDGSGTVRLTDDDVSTVAASSPCPATGPNSWRTRPTRPPEADRFLFNGADVRAAVVPPPPF